MMANTVMTAHQKTITLALGGARSGKTSYAETTALNLAAEKNKDVNNNGKKAIYVATGQAFDDEMAARIARHRDIRADRFITIEEPLDLAAVLARHGAGDVLLIDSIGTWLTNHMIAESNMEDVINGLISALTATTATVVLVSDEVGMGIVPEGAMSRAFRDHIGMTNQRVGMIADTVAFLVAGLPMMVKNNTN